MGSAWNPAADADDGHQQTLFIPEQDGLYRRFSETHYQRDYDLQQIKIMLEKAGFVCEAIYDDYSEETVHAESERAVFIGRKE